MKRKAKAPPCVAPKEIMIPVPHKDLNRWIGEYLLSAMVISAMTSRNTNMVPDRVGPIRAIHDLEDGGCMIEFDAEWDDEDKPERSGTKSKSAPSRSRRKKS